MGDNENTAINTATQEQPVATPRDAWMLSELNDKQFLVRRTPKGTFIPVASAITLYEAKAQLAPVGMSKSDDDEDDGAAASNFMRTNLGYQAYNKVANLTILTPERIYIDGFDRPCPNPYLEIDGQSGMVNRAVCRKQCFGFSPLGVMVITSITVSFNPKATFIKDAMKKIQRDKSAGRLMTKAAAEALGDDFWFFPVEGDYGIAVYLGNAQILKAFNTYLRTKDFADRRVQTIAERIVYSKHPCMPQGALRNLPGTAKNHTVKEAVYGYIHDLSQEEIQDAAAAANEGEAPTVRGQRVETIEAEPVPEAGEHEIIPPEIDEPEEGSL
jgi:hypothetical protein